MTNRAWHLKSRPQGMPTAENFELKDLPGERAPGRLDPGRE
jgi:NADPH-dependent curcumin reductase CurA